MACITMAPAATWWPSQYAFLGSRHPGCCMARISTPARTWQNAITPFMHAQCVNGSTGVGVHVGCTLSAVPSSSSFRYKSCNAGSISCLGHYNSFGSNNRATPTLCGARQFDGRLRASRQGLSTDGGQVIQPLKRSKRPSSNVIPLKELDTMANQAETQQLASRKTTSRPNLRHDSRRGALVKVRVAPRRYKLRKSFDQPRKLHIKPTDPTFEGRITAEINGVYGPRQLTKIVETYGPHLTAIHCSSAVSLFAGMVTGKQLSQDELQNTYQAPAAKAADFLMAKMQHATLLDCARAIYGLARLQLHMPQLLSAVEQHTRGQLATATPQIIGGLGAGLAHWGYMPAEGWVQELCIEAFPQMAWFGAQDLANLLFALACWRKSVSQPFLLRCLTAFRGHWGTAGCHVPTLVRFIYAVTQLPPCQPLPVGMIQALPELAPVYRHHDAWREHKQSEAVKKAIGLSAPSAIGRQPQSASAEQLICVDSSVGLAAGSDDERWSSSNGTAISNTSSYSSISKSAAATYRLPSFNWLVAFLAESRRQMDRMKPAELSTLLWCMACLNHTPDLIFMECWYRAAASHMHAFTPDVLATALQALGMLQPGKEVPGGVSGKFLQVVLTHSREIMSSCNGSELSKVLWGFAELRFWPGQAWMDQWVAAAAQQLQGMAPINMADIIWALARLRYTPPTPLTSKLSATVTNQLSDFSTQQLAIVIWGFSRLGLKPDRRWLIRFRALAGSMYNEDGVQRLTEFVAGLLAQQNREQYTRKGAISTPARV